MTIIAGIERPDTGRVVTHPPLPAGVPPDRLGWRQVAFVPQALGLLDELTVAENVALPARLDRGATQPYASGTPVADPATAELLARLEIDHLAGRYPSHTSGGEQQRTAVARALRLRPRLLLADEPTGHQDRARIALLLAVLAGTRRHRRGGAAGSHDPDVIAAADRVITLADGRVESDTRSVTAGPPRSAGS